MKAPSYQGLKPSSARASAAAKGASRKSGTKPELLLRKALWHRGLRYRVAPSWLPGRPDIAFTRQRLALFVDGDFWHGRNLEERLRRLARGHNARYWTRKVLRNVERDAAVVEELQRAGWRVVRFWESEVRQSPDIIADQVAEFVSLVE